MSGLQRRLFFFCLLAIAAFFIVRNMVFMALSDALTITGDFDPSYDPGKLSSTVVSLRNVWASSTVSPAPGKGGNSSKLRRGGNKTRDVLLQDEVNKNHTLLKANMSHVGEIVKQLKEQPDLVNVAKPHPFRYIINSPNVCGKEDPVFLLVYVHTAPDHYKRRTVIRQTWGNMFQYEDTIRVVFFMGVTNLGREVNASSVQKALYFEQGQYQDMVQEDFLDTYHNLTHKGVSALKWIANNCMQAKFVLKTDDDIFVNMYTLLRHLRRMESRGPENTRSLLMCAVWYGMPVMRTGKWKVTKEEWHDDYYPTYCSGSAFVLTTDVAERLYRVSYHVPFFWVDDFYITGLLPLKAGNITHKQFLSTYVLNGDKLEEMFTGPSWYLYIFSHLHELDRIQAVWTKMSMMYRGEIAVEIRKALPGELQPAS